MLIACNQLTFSKLPLLILAVVTACFLLIISSKRVESFKFMLSKNPVKVQINTKLVNSFHAFKTSVVFPKRMKISLFLRHSFPLDEKNQKSWQKITYSLHLLIVRTRRTDFCRSSLIIICFESGSLKPSSDFKNVELRFKVSLLILSVLILPIITVF